MKHCPVCNRNYSDDQNFCLDDGANLMSAPGGSYDSSSAPTINYPYAGGAPPTQMMPATPTASARPPYTSPPPAYVAPYQPQQKRSPVPWIVGALAVVVVGIVVVVLLSSRQSSTPPAANTGGTTPGVSPSPKPTISSTPTLSSWETVSGDRFSFSMPEKPSHSENNVPSAAGDLKLHMYTLAKGYETFTTGYTEYPDIVFNSAESEALLDGAQEGALSDVNGEVLSQRKITMDGNPGREIVGTSASQNMGFTARVILAKPRMYMMVYTQYDKSKAISEDGKKFLDSFKLTN
jgi:hypothetical protein